MSSTTAGMALSERRLRRQREVVMPWRTFARMGEYASQWGRPLVGKKKFYRRYLAYRFLEAFRVFVLLAMVVAISVVIGELLPDPVKANAFVRVAVLFLSGVLSELVMEALVRFFGSPSYGRLGQCIGEFAVDVRVIRRYVYGKRADGLRFDALDGLDDVVFLISAALRPATLALAQTRGLIKRSLRR